MGEEKRGHSRFKIQQMIELSFGKETFVQANGVDISEGGLFCQTSEPIDPQTELFIMIGLETDGEDQTIRCEGMVTRSLQSNDGYDVGVSFMGMQEGDREKIKTFISEQNA